MDLNELMARIVLTGAALGAVVQWLIRPAYRALRSITHGIQFIEHELKANSGKSLRDVAVRAERRFDLLFDHLGIDMPDALKAPTEDPT